LKEREYLGNADCKNIVDRCPEGNDISDPIEKKEFLESWKTVSFHGLGQIPLLFQKVYS
jgi:hypothetical protein